MFNLAHHQGIRPKKGAKEKQYTLVLAVKWTPSKNQNSTIRNVKNVSLFHIKGDEHIVSIDVVEPKDCFESITIE
jgi:hypothetical protein